MRRELSIEDLARVLDHWRDQAVAVRVLAGADDLVAVFHGTLGARSDQKQPARFWPLLSAADDDGAEVPGIYLHEELFEQASVHRGGDVVELCQAGVNLNLRRL